jgi:hypothetical protein
MDFCWRISTALHRMELTYYAARGTCDKIRILLAEAGVSYTENLITGADYEDIKDGIEFGGLPIWSKMIALQFSIN